VRSALLSVRGVTRAQVRLGEKEAIVTYEPEQAKIEDLIKAVSETDGPTGQRYSATVKKE
jgi:copper chaperone CopZ